MKEKFYQGIVLMLLSMSITLFCISHRNYMELLDVNEQTHLLLEEQRVANKNLSGQWKYKYEDLLYKYGALLVEYDQLSKQLEDDVCGFTQEEVYLIAQCVEAEAGYGNNKSQQYITQVILNRLDSEEFPNSVEEVIYEKTASGNPQFSVAYNGMIDRVVEEETLLNVQNVIVNGTNLPKYVCYFYSSSVKENWVCSLNTYTECEGTVFAYHSKEDL